MKLITHLPLLFMAFCMVSCHSENEVDLNIECPCLFKDEQPPYYKSCQHMGKDEERWECMGDELIKDIYEDLKYTESAKENCTEGTVVVRILISDKGEVLKTEIVSDTLLGDGLEEEALKAVNLLNGNWCSGLINCKPVENEFVVPIKFKYK